ncbi:MAG: transcriptional regulator [Spongiibacteraceae bacterium]|jgi:LacI family transcriptional regulator, repressor for deo operon, udp, cdd, tsx, nupC, and nupG|nr:transcriptional regulator [Spongiibacteraceae bacterium]
MADFSIKDVARLAGVSIGTVSRSMNTPEKVSQKTRAKVEDAVRRTGYSPNRLAQSFRRGRTNLVMVVLPSVGDPFFTEVMRGIRAVAETSGYSVVIEETQFNTMTADKIGSMLVSNQTDGVILLASVSPFGTEIMASGGKQLLPIVVGCETVSPELSALPSVQIDNAAAASEMTDYLIAQGHRRIAMISGQSSSLLTKDREIGYRQAMQAARLRVEDGWVIDGGLTINGARAATRALLSGKSRPSAIFCATDEMAIGCLREVKAASLSVPGDISIAGFDDIRYAEVTDPPLTTISQPAGEIGERVMRRLLDRIKDSESASSGREFVPHELVIRESVAAPTN